MSRPHPHAGSGSERISQLDALRGAACLLVLIAHLSSVRGLGWVPGWLGTAGVGVFFALSGFLITRILLANRAAGHGLARFYSRRVARIFPIYYLTLGVVAIFCYGPEVEWAASFSFNFRFLASSRDYFQAIAHGASVPPVAHFWSLCVEEHFYWVWPVLVMLLPIGVSRKLPWVIILGTPWWSYELMGWLSAAGFSHAEVDGLISRTTPTQLVAISLGALAAFHEPWLRSPHAAGMRRPLILGSMLIGLGGALLLLTQLLPPVVGKSLFATALHTTSGGVFLAALAWNRLGEIRLLKWMGAISYGAYLFHLPIYSACRLLNGNHAASPWWGVLAFGLTLGCAALSYRFVETPILAFAKRLEQPESPRLRSPIFVAGGATLTLLAALVFVANLAYPYAAVVEAVSRNADARSSDRIATPARRGADATPGLSQIQTLILGSSHSANGFATPEFPESAYNLALGGQDLWYDCEILKVAERRLPNLKRVIFGVSIFSFRHLICDDDSQRWRQSLYFHTWKVPAAHVDSGEQRYSLLTLLNACDTVKRASAKAHFADELLRGWEPRMGGHGEPGSNGQDAVGRHCNCGREHVAENYQQLLGAIEDCQQRGIECILVSTPKHADYQRHLPHWYQNETMTRVRAIVERTGVQFADYSSNCSFSDDDFYDADHLNPLGAVKFTRMFLRDFPFDPPSGAYDEQLRAPVPASAARPTSGKLHR